MAIVWIVLAQLVCVQLISGAVVNMALGKPVDVSSRHRNRNPAIAVNGDTRAVDPCCIMHTAVGRPFGWWRVDLQVQVQDATVKIYFSTNYKMRRNGVQLYTSTTLFSSYPGGQLCHSVTGRADGTDIPDVVSVNCTGTWRYLLVYTRTDNDGQGAVLDFGEVEVLGCNGTYGGNCDMPCSQCAATPLACDRYTGACPPGGCKPGWIGDDCSQECPLGTNYGANCAKFCSARQCRPSSSSCDHVTGRCTDGCQDGWKGEDCTSQCTQGTKYGANCAKFCSARQCRPSSSCHHVTGLCTDGWKGEDCTSQCTPGENYGANCAKICSARQCRPSSSSCDHVTGRCTDGCQDGWKGEDCTSQCTLGTNYGPNCEKFCSSRRCRTSSSSCDHVTGQCTGGCQDGWAGVDCTSQCTLGVNYGANCMKFCNTRRCRTLSSSCDRETGRCTDGCQDGWKGEDCTSQCPEGTFGLGCLNCSTRHCEGELDCPGDGTCSGGCQDGWTLDTCTQECTLGTNYGPNCEKFCSSRRCRTSSSSCDHVTGQCTGGCQDGWAGVDCTSQCPEGTFGLGCLNCSTRHCEGELDCPGDGTCSGGCQDGWTLDTCTQACPSGTYGPGCSSICGKCTGDNICNHVTGSCPGDCEPGWRGRQCKDTCSSGRYGVNCKENCGECNGTCDVVDGHCSGGCVDGYCGIRCQNKLEGNSPGQDTVTAAVIGAVIGAVLMFVLVGGIFVCFVRCGRLRWIKSTNHQKQFTEMDDVSSQQIIGHSVSEQPQSEAARVYNNDYAVLDVETKSDNKDYDVIKNKDYENT